MANKGKRYKAVSSKVEAQKLYVIEEACELLCETGKAKFDETVEVAIRLGVDPKKADQNIRGGVALPHGLGKEIRVAVFAKGEKAAEAQEAGADIVGSDDLVKDIQDGKIEFDSVVATPDMMGQVGKIGKILGPRGLMPSPKVGTVTFDVGDAVRLLKAGKAEYRVDKVGIVHAGVGKVSFGAQKIKENIEALIVAVNKAKPSTSKGLYLKSASVCTTMGPGIKVDCMALRNL
ncbi:MAG: 50S ribosomal protein L1 [Bdellovibrionales bacterium]|nr:50S ribosomal protein L1 [Bdellovibrionales bacterium]